MQAGTYTFTCCFDTEAILPSFKGSTLRGSLGHALKKIVCALRRQECRACLLASTCAHAFLFEEKSSAATNTQGRPPHPYVLVPPDDERRGYGAGDYFSFSLRLFGRANDFLPHLVYAVQEMGRAGLGKISSAPGRFRLQEVRSDEAVLFSGNTTLTLPTRIPELLPAAATERGIDSLALICETPLRLKHNNRFQTDLPFHLVIRAALRRISSLEATYGNGEPALDYKGLAARATAVRSIKESCRWVEIERYSNRQQTAMLIGGIQGGNTYHGEGLGEFLPLLRYCEVTHLGKQTSFGLGRIRITTDPAG